MVKSALRQKRALTGTGAPARASGTLPTAFSYLKQRPLRVVRTHWRYAAGGPLPCSRCSAPGRCVGARYGNRRTADCCPRNRCEAPPSMSRRGLTRSRCTGPAIARRVLRIDPDHQSRRPRLQFRSPDSASVPKSPSAWSPSPATSRFVSPGEDEHKSFGKTFLNFFGHAQDLHNRDHVVPGCARVVHGISTTVSPPCALRRQAESQFLTGC